MAESANTTDLGKLTFKRSMSPSEFMKEHGYDKLDVVINPKTGKRFLSTTDAEGKSEAVGKASKSDDYKNNPVISWCEDPVSKEEFWMLHGQANVEHSFSL